MRLYAVLFAVGLAVYGTLAWERLGRQSIAPQFVVQADAWVHGHLDVQPVTSDVDWAKLETVTLADGRDVQGRRMITQPLFRTLSGERIPTNQIRQSKGFVWYVSFPPVPAVLMLPSALIGGRGGNDVIPTVLVAAAILPLFLLLLRRLREAGLSKRTEAEELWLVALLAFGTVLFFSSVRGEVWYTAQVCGVVLALVYTWASVEAKRPVAAGLALGAAALTRTAMAFMLPLFLFELWRCRRGEWKRVAVRFAIPIVGFAIVGMVYNALRFGSPIEFGHTFLDVRQQLLIERFGLAGYHYLGRNLAVMLTLLPEWLGHKPWIQISGHGLALWVTTPALVLLLWPREKPPIHRALWITVACVAAPSLFYMNSGWVQFGYRFSLDYMVFLLALLAIGGRPISRVLIGVCIAINLFGAVTFGRYGQYYRTAGTAYDTVVAN